MSDRVLLIEDEQDALELYGGQLRRDGMTVITEKDADRGIEAVKKQKPDLVLLDLMLPGKSGFEVLDFIKKNQSFRRIPVVTLTNMAEEVGHERAIASGASSYIVKAERTPKQVSLLVKEVLKESKPK